MGQQLKWSRTITYVSKISKKFKKLVVSPHMLIVFKKIYKTSFSEILQGISPDNGWDTFLETLKKASSHNTETFHLMSKFDSYNIYMHTNFI